MRAELASSSSLATVEYDAGTSVMTLAFRDGRTYVYRLVPRSVVDELVAADSPGQFFNSHIKGKYPFEPDST